MIQDVENIFDLTGSENFKKLFRINWNGLRLYIENEPFKMYSGLTGALSAATFNGDQEKRRLKSWRESMINSFGKENTDNYVSATADFGTLLHQALVTLKDNKEVNWAEERDKAESYFRDVLGGHELSLIKKTAYEYLKHVASLMQFIHDRVDKINAIEVPVIWDELNIATPIDLVCNCRQTPKAAFTPTVINIKTSSQISNSHIDQVASEFTMWTQTYDIQVEHAAIMRTKDWTEGKTPTYDYKYMDMMEALERSGKLFNRLNLCLQDPNSTYYPNPTSKQFSGVCKLGEVPNIIIKGIQDEWSDYWNERNETT